MASIKGVQLKAVETFKTMDGVGFTANLYMDNKKVGTVQDLGNGGGLDYFISDKEKREEFSSRVESYYAESPAFLQGETDFIEEIFALWETEKQFKKNSKKGFPITAVFTFSNRTDSLEEMFQGGSYNPDTMIGVTNMEVLKEEMAKQKPKGVHIFRKLEDFILA